MRPDRKFRPYEPRRPDRRSAFRCGLGVGQSLSIGDRFGHRSLPQETEPHFRVVGKRQTNLAMPVVEDLLRTDSRGRPGVPPHG
jgi:hypothetical protein